MKIELRKVFVYLALAGIMMISGPVMAEEAATDNPAPVQQQEIAPDSQQGEVPTIAPENIQPDQAQPQTDTNAPSGTGQ